MGRNVYRRNLELTPLQVYRIFKVTVAIMNGEYVPDNVFDSIIGLIDRKFPDMKFEDLRRLADKYDIIKRFEYRGKGGNR